MKVWRQSDCVEDCVRLRDQVREFHRMMDQPIGSKPSVPANDRVRFRLRLIAEEFFEAHDSLGWGRYEELSHARQFVGWLLIHAPVKVDLPAFADALGDLDYVIEGARIEFGINGAPIADAIHAANMAKASGPVRPDGKQLKPEGWTAPDIAGELEKQGWDRK
jgi:predicted HAD superfamily Cof-like phosphohydrolase